MSQTVTKNMFQPTATETHREAQTPRFKITVVGDGGTGKSAFLARHLVGVFTRKYVATLGANVYQLLFNTNYGPLIFDVWDTAGQAKFCGLGDRYYPESKGAIIFHDVTAKVTSRNVNNWRRDMRRVCPNIPIIICGNKVDINNGTDFPGLDVSKNEMHCGISVKSNLNCDLPFLFLARKLTGHDDLCFPQSVAHKSP